MLLQKIKNKNNDIAVQHSSRACPIMMIIGLLFIFMNEHLHYERLKKHITILQQQQNTITAQNKKKTHHSQRLILA